MRVGDSEFDKSYVESICSLFEEKYDINFITSQYDLNYNVILRILESTHKYDDILKSYVCQLDISDNIKIMIISDTHYGSKYDNIIYTHSAFDFAIKNGIKIILHCGDILEGVFQERKFMRLGYEDQVEFFLDNYPYDKTINTHAILGNHDFPVIKKNKQLYNILDSRDDVDIMGLSKVFINWNGQIISLHHKIKNYRMVSPEFFYENFNFKGHSHFFNIKRFEHSDHINIPALCDDPVSYMSSSTNHVDDKTSLKPGFLVAEMYDDCMLVTNYYFNDNIINKGKEHTLTKKIS